MSSAKQDVPVPRAPTLPNKTTPEQRYWRSYINPQLIKENHPITSIEFNPTTNDFAISSSTKIQIFSSKTRQVIKTFSRFKDVVYGCNYRYDGKLLVASDASGLVSIYDSYQPRNLLVSLTPSSYPTHVAKFHPTIGNQLITGSDDRILRVYDISQTSKGPILAFDDTHHGDYIRSVNFVPNDPNLIITGCYDGKVRIWDTRDPSKVVTEFNQENPVEDILAISSNTLVSSGGPYVKIWDLNRMDQIHQLNNFNKSTTSLSTTGMNSLIVGSLDSTVKIFDYNSINWNVQFGWKFGNGVLACKVSPNMSNSKSHHLVTGLTSGLISIRTKKSEPKVKQGVKTEVSNSYARLMKGKDYGGDEEDHVINNSKYTTGKPNKSVSELMSSYKKYLGANGSLDDIKPHELNQEIIQCKKAQEICGMLELLGV
ncbi:hypothetical protein G210_2613 [Candida maltosa Xu316]|uniref:Uncharacterized protein n=1 Tax=Candida maltosa (strain Xu316) TaxID=1245528 RepID=M3J523_CANMX|nr:hypothetical protein G210_2613 [Candida maltosa Xu316]